MQLIFEGSFHFLDFRFSAKSDCQVCFFFCFFFFFYIANYTPCAHKTFINVLWDHMSIYEEQIKLMEDSP